MNIIIYPKHWKIEVDQFENQFSVDSDNYFIEIGDIFNFPINIS